MSERSVNRHPAARREIIEAAEFFERREAGLGDRFLDALDESLDKIAANPNTGVLHDSGTKLLMLDGFPWGIVYLERGEEAYVISVSDLRRKPRFWAERLKDNR